jgi:cytidylate kinase
MARGPDFAFVIAVDGAAASGKGTIAGKLAAHYGLPHLDTGLLYRAVGAAMAAAGADLDDAETAGRLAQALDLARLGDPGLTTAAAGEAASRVAALPAVRSALLKLQKDFAAQPGGAVLDGRDIATVIAPAAPAKLYVDAAPEVRAHRRWLQTSARGETRSEAETLADLLQRDARDAGRAHAPMSKAADAVLLDTSLMSISEAFDEALRHVEQARRRWEALEG